MILFILSSPEPAPYCVLYGIEYISPQQVLINRQDHPVNFGNIQMYTQPHLAPTVSQMAPKNLIFQTVSCNCPEYLHRCLMRCHNKLCFLLGTHTFQIQNFMFLCLYMILFSYFLMLDNLNSCPLKIIVTLCHAPGIALGLEDLRTSRSGSL